MIARQQVDRADSSSTVSDVAELHGANAVDGLLLVPDGSPTAFDRLVDEVMPQLRRLGIAGDHPLAATFRDRLGLARPANRYANTAGVAQ